MKNKKKNLFRLARIERISTMYDSQSRVIQEKWEYFYPIDGSEMLPSAIGFSVDSNVDSNIDEE
jgi:hypothetical protein